MCCHDDIPLMLGSVSSIGVRLYWETDWIRELWGSHVHG